MRPISDLTAARRLLRDLRNPRALKTNPLVAARFPIRDRFESKAEAATAHRGIAEEIRGFVLFTLRSLPLHTESKGYDTRCARQCEILYRFDVKREPRKALLSDLGLSRSHFYRELRKGLLLLSAALRTELHINPQPISASRDQFGEAMRWCDLARSVGSFDAAASLLRQILAGVADDGKRAHALCQMAKISLDRGRLRAARDQLHDSQGILSRHVDVNGNQPSIAAYIDVVRAELAWLSGDSHGAVRYIDEASALVHLGAQDLHPQARALIVRLLILSATVNKHIGTLNEALRAVNRASSLIVDGVDDAIDSTVDLLLVRGVLHAYQLGRLSAAISDCERAIELATEHHLVRKVAVGLGYLSLFKQWAGDGPSGLELARRAVTLSRGVCGVKEQYTIATILTRALSKAGSPQKSIALIRRARRGLDEFEYIIAHSYLVESQALSAMGNFSDAVDAADMTIRRAAPLGFRRYVGVALREKAKAEAALGHAGRALNSLRNAIEILEEGKGCYQLIDTYRLATDLSHNQKERAHYRKLLATISN